MQGVNMVIQNGKPTSLDGKNLRQELQSLVHPLLATLVKQPLLSHTSGDAMVLRGDFGINEVSARNGHTSSFF